MLIFCTHTIFFDHFSDGKSKDYYRNKLLNISLLFFTSRHLKTEEISLQIWIAGCHFWQRYLKAQFLAPLMTSTVLVTVKSAFPLISPWSQMLFFSFNCPITYLYQLKASIILNFKKNHPNLHIEQCRKIMRLAELNLVPTAQINWFILVFEFLRCRKKNTKT
jgi:hypothetical protein